MDFRAEGLDLEVNVHAQLAHVDRTPLLHHHYRLPNHLEVRQRRQQHLILPRELADPAKRRPAVDLAQLDLEQRRPAYRARESSSGGPEGGLRISHGRLNSRSTSEFAPL